MNKFHIFGVSNGINTRLLPLEADDRDKERIPPLSHCEAVPWIEKRKQGS